MNWIAKNEVGCEFRAAKTLLRLTKVEVTLPASFSFLFLLVMEGTGSVVLTTAIFRFGCQSSYSTPIFLDSLFLFIPCSILKGPEAFSRTICELPKMCLSSQIFIHFCTKQTQITLIWEDIFKIGFRHFNRHHISSLMVYGSHG